MLPLRAIDVFRRAMPYAAMPRFHDAADIDIFSL